MDIMVPHKFIYFRNNKWKCWGHWSGRQINHSQLQLQQEKIRFKTNLPKKKEYSVQYFSESKKVLASRTTTVTLAVDGSSFKKLMSTPLIYFSLPLEWLFSEFDPIEGKLQSKSSPRISLLLSMSCVLHHQTNNMGCESQNQLLLIDWGGKRIRRWNMTYLTHSCFCSIKS